MNWDYLQPVKIRFGKGRVSEVKDLAKEMGIKNGLLVADPFFFTNGLAERIVKESEGAIIASFGDLSPNPDVTEVDACAAIIREKEIGFVVALGGGSSMDCAKAAASIALTDDSIRKYHGTGVAMPQEHLPLIAVPTTAGTGSEVTCVSVLTDHANGKKSPIVSDGFFPSYAIIDPELTYTMPPKVTAGTGIDVLSHALEGFWSKGHQPICDACALHAAELVFHSLKEAGLVEVRAGFGGASLAKPLDEITLLDVYKAVDCVEDGLFHFHESPNPACPVGKNIHGVLDGHLARAQAAMEEQLRAVTLASLAESLNSLTDCQKTVRAPTDV